MKEKNVYPIQAKLTYAGAEGEVPVEILIISYKGIMVHSLKMPLMVNRTYTVKFEFPLIKEEVQVPATVFRTYSEIVENPMDKRKIRHISEVLFRAPSKKFNASLVKFLANVSYRRKA